MGLLDLFVKRDTIYFPGCITYFKFREGFELYQRVFSRLGIRFRTLDTQRCSGFEPWEAGYDFELRKIVRENFDLFKEENVRKIITSEPGCYKIFRDNYPEILPYWDIEIINIWDLILEKLIKKSWLIEKKEEIVTFHDSCYLGRYSGVYDSPREILEMLGYSIREMDNNSENSLCCGSCGGLSRTNPKLARKIAKERLLQAKRIGVKKMIVVGFENYSLLNESAQDLDMEVFELGEILASALGIKKLKDSGPEVNGESILIETKANMNLQNKLVDEDYGDEIKEIKNDG